MGLPTVTMEEALTSRGTSSVHKSCCWVGSWVPLSVALQLKCTMRCLHCEFDACKFASFRLLLPAGKPSHGGQ